MTEHLTSRISWCPLGVAIRDVEGNIDYRTHPEPVSDISEIPADIGNVSTFYLPLETMLTRTFNLPLKHVRHLDAAMLAQEFADVAGINPDAWWLAWQAHQTETGISGIALGLPKKTQATIQNHPVLQQTPVLLADGYARLSNWLSDNTYCDEHSFAVIDADAEGVFFGFYRTGSWQGMRRLNADMHDTTAAEAVSQQLIWSLQSMRFSLDEMPITGRLTSEMAKLFPVTVAELPVQTEDALPQRHILNLMLPEPAANTPRILNIRHGKWAVRRKSSMPRSWYRPAILALSLSVLWLALTTMNNYQLETLLHSKQDEITSAFHRGLPNQPVMIDALAQLRQASNLGGSGSDGGLHITHQLSIISKVFEQHAWQMQDLRIDDEGTQVTGKVKDLDTLNTIREKLAQEASTSVQITDTDLNGDAVAFKVRWQ